MIGQGAQIFADELTRFAAEVSEPQVARIAVRTAAPLRVEVRGRPAVGCRTVARALADFGTAAIESGDVDLTCYVLTETVKPEDTAAVGALAVAGRPTLVVVNKADVAGGLSAKTVSARLGAPAVSMAAVFAVAAADARLDAGFSTLLRRLSGVDTVIGWLHVAGAVPRYRRMLDAVARLAALAAVDARVAAFLAADATVAARAAAADAVLAAAGSEPGPADPLARARWWRRRRTAPLSALHRACADDIVRAALRSWSAGAR